MNETQKTSESNPDSFQGMTWAERATFGVLGAVLDPADKSGRKNAFIDRVQRIALQKALGQRQFSRALDFGCGTGRLLRFLAERSKEVYALDRTPEMLEIARHQYEMPVERFVRWNDLSMAFEDGYFDLLISVGVLCTMSRSDFDRVTRELRRVCATGGTLILIEQVDNARELMPTTYREAFSDFECVTASPVRASASRVMTLAANPKTPRSLVAPLASLEIMRLKRSTFDPDTRGYFDYLFEFRKRVTF